MKRRSTIQVDHIWVKVSISILKKINGNNTLFPLCSAMKTCKSKIRLVVKVCLELYQENFQNFKVTEVAGEMNSLDAASGPLLLRK